MRERVRVMRERVFDERERVSARACLSPMCQWVPWVWRICVGVLSGCAVEYFPQLHSNIHFARAHPIGDGDRPHEGGALGTLNR